VTRDPQESIRAFETARARLFKLAHRMLGSIGDAEDAVQDLYLRWRSVEEDVNTPEAWLVTACARLCIDRLRAAKRERAAYEGPWLPDPIVVVAGDASADLERADDMTLAMLLVLERLTRRERAAFILREAFDYDYAEIGDVLKASPAACRQLASRAARRRPTKCARGRARMNEVPGWVRAIATARREWWAKLEPKLRAEAEEAVRQYRTIRRGKARERVERMRRILAAYNSGATADEIGETLGMGGRAVREFAARRGVTITRSTGRRFRLLVFDPGEEAVLRSFAADFGATPTEAAQAILEAALESDAHPARRMLCVKRRIGREAGLGLAARENKSHHFGGSTKMMGEEAVSPRGAATLGAPASPRRAGR
jgi:RNA polymerase sigma factor (sigma-70 family)